MAAAKQTKAPGRQDSIRRILESLEKRYRADFRMPEEQPVLETLIYAICLEDCTFAEAETFYQRIGTLFHDFNEARVSSITELSHVFVKSPFAEWKAFRFRHLLTHVFESFYAFDFESLLRKSNEHANRLLGRIPEISQFARNYTMKHCVGINLLPLDNRMRDAVAWLGLGTSGQTPQRTATALKSVVRKNEADRFCGLIRCLATDPLMIREIESEHKEDPRPVHELTTAVERLETLFTETARRKRKSTGSGKAAAKKTTAKKTAAKKTAAKKTAAKKTAKKATRKSSKR